MWLSNFCMQLVYARFVFIYRFPCTPIHTYRNNLMHTLHWCWSARCGSNNICLLISPLGKLLKLKVRDPLIQVEHENWFNNPHPWPSNAVTMMFPVCMSEFGISLYIHSNTQTRFHMHFFIVAVHCFIILCKKSIQSPKSSAIFVFKYVLYWK